MRMNKFMPNNMGYEILGGLKIKDGLFLGDQYAAQDLEFIITNKITHIINCSGKQIANHWLSLGINYLSYNWLDIDTQVIFDPKDEILNQTYKFIEDTLNKGESVLVQSVKGHNRSVCIIAAYLMRKFRWTLYKTLEYLHSRRPDLEMNANFFNQLMNLEVKLTKMGLAPKTYNWDEVGDDMQNFDSEELLIRNTYLNSKNLGVAEFKDIPDKFVKPKISWIDNNSNDKARLTTVMIPKYDEIEFGKRERLMKHRSGGLVRSIVKGSNKSFEIVGKENKREPKKRLEKVKSSTILKKSDSEIEFFSENNLNLILEETKVENNERVEERKKPKNVVIKKNTDQKYLLSFNKNPSLKITTRISSQKELLTINENPSENTRKVQEKTQKEENNQSEEQYTNMMNRQLKKEIDQYKNDDEKPTTKINYNYNIQVSSNKDLKGKTVEKQTKGTTLQEKKDLLFMTYDLPQNKVMMNRNENPIFRNSVMKKFRKHKRKTNENQESNKKLDPAENLMGKPLIENSLKYSQKIYSNKFPQYNNFLITNNVKPNVASSNYRNSNENNTDIFSYSNGFNTNLIRNFPAGYNNDLESEFTVKNIINPNRPSTAPLKKDRENLAEKYYSNDMMNNFNNTYAPRDSFKRTNIRQNSAQPANRENEQMKPKMNFRTASPAQFTSTGPFQPPAFFGLKPKWKF